MFRIFSAVFLFACLTADAQQLDVRKTMRALAEKYGSAEQYSFDGELLLLGQRGQDPVKTMSHAKVSFAVAPQGKYSLRIEAEGRDSYLLVSNGQKSWAFVPKLKQYTEEESAMVSDDDEGSAAGGDDERDLSEKFARMIVPMLAELETNLSGADFHGESDVKYGGKKAKWPVLRVMSKPASDGAQSLTQIALDPQTLDIGHLGWAMVQHANGEKTVIQMTMDFNSFEAGPVPESTFTFEPPKRAKLVDTLPIPGQTGSFLVNHEAPDFELKTFDGEKVRLSDLRGKPILLSFWASWCGPCRQELPHLADLNDKYKGKGLVILGVNDEGKGIAKKFSDKNFISFPTLDDSGEKVHRLYRVRSIPSVFLIDREGRVVRFLSGGRDEASLRKALDVLGL